MKKFRFKIYLILLCIIPLLIMSCKINREISYVDAKILSINENIVEGKLIGRFLGSPSGKYTTDKIIVGVSVPLQDNIKQHVGYDEILLDLELKHAELARYKDRKNIPLKLYFKGSRDNTVIEFVVYLQGRKVRRVFYNELEGEVI